MSKEDVYATNNKIVFISASTVAIILVIMTIVFLVLLARRHIRERASRDGLSESLPSIKGRSVSCLSDASSYGNSRGEPQQQRVTIQNGLDPHVEVDNEEETEQVREEGTDNLSPTDDPIVLSDSLSSAGQYHFSFRELEFADNCTDGIGIVNPGGPSEKEEENGNRDVQNNLRIISEVLSSDSGESCDDSEDDTTFETTVEA
eukprot:Seg4378.2 transcript_id=Seg4378.2/GoldUCD/mRNA.D3Y31 product="hypothetical protein" protein_id=Seg4378.2/GoldUCD/D3Y31